MQPWLERIGQTLAEVWIFGISGALLMFAGYWVFDKLTPRIDFAKELVDNKNMAVAIMVAAIIFGMALIIFGTMLPWPPGAPSAPIEK